jgi:ATP-grasp in the biosynthetic pathway with Ter operon
MRLMESGNLAHPELRQDKAADLKRRVSGGIGIGGPLGTAARSRTPNQPPVFSSPRDQRSTEQANSTVLILASEWRLPYRTLRCAARCFDRVYVLGTRGARPLAASRFCRSFHYLPFEEGFGGRSIPFINRLCEQLSVTWIVPSDPPTTLFLSESGAMLGARSYPVPDRATFDLLNDKSTFVGLCQKLGVATPLTEVLPNKQQLLDRLQDGRLTLPLVAKPINLQGSQGVMVLHPGEALGVASRIGYEPIMVQEYIGGRDLCAFYFCREGRVELEALYHHGGHFIEFIEHPGVSQQCRKIIEATNYTGVIGFDIRQRDVSDFCFLECNPRFWYNMELTMLAGVNFVEAGVKVPKLAGQALDVRLAGKVIGRPSGLLRKLPAPWAGIPTRLAVLAYLTSDLLMMVSIGLSKAARTVRAAMATLLSLADLFRPNAPHQDF